MKETEVASKERIVVMIARKSRGEIRIVSVTPQKYPIIFIVILLYILGMN